jgi:hypothetical protein
MQQDLISKIEGHHCKDLVFEFGIYILALMFYKMKFMHTVCDWKYIFVLLFLDPCAVVTNLINISSCLTLLSCVHHT